MSSSMWRGRGALVAALVMAMVWLAALGAGSVSAAACTNLCYVNGATGNDANDGDTPATAKKTIQAAVNQVMAGGTVNVAAGAYPENVVIGKALTLSGAAPATTIIDPVTFMEITASNVTVQDLTVQTGGTHGVRIQSIGVPLANILFDTVHVKNNPERGIEISSTTITNLQVIDSLFDNNESGLRLSSSSVVDGLTIDNTTFQNHTNTSHGVGFYQANDGNNGYVKDLHVVDSTFSNNGFSGIHVEEAVDVVIEESTFSGNGHGFRLLDYYLSPGAAAGNILIQNNTFTDNKQPSVQLLSGNENGLGGAVTVNNNTFDQDTAVPAADRGVIDVAQKNGLAHAAVTISNNVIAFSGNPAAPQQNFGFHLRGGVDAITLTGNTVDSSAGANATLTGLMVFSQDSVYGGIEATAVINAHHNGLAGLHTGAAVFDDVADLYGNLPAGASVKVNRNDLSGNTAYGFRGGSPTNSDAKCNWWGHASGPAGAGPGSGSAITNFVDFNPWLVTDNLDGNCAVPGSGGTITVRKETSPNGDTTDFLFDPSWSALNFTLKDGESQASGTLTAGSYSVAELNPPAGWTLAGSGCVNGVENAPVNSITVEDGDAWVCTFNNTKKGTITVKKETTPDGNPTLFTFDPSWSANNFTLSDGGSANSGPLSAGAYSVAEINLPAYWTQQSASCVNGAANAPINAIPVADGDAWVCTFNNVLDLPGSGLLYIAPNHNNGVVGGVPYNDEDIVVNTLGTSDWAMYFDGTDVGITKNLTDFTFTPDSCMLMTFNGNQNVPGVGLVKPQDVVKFCATQTGTTTAGAFTMVFDGSDVGLAAGAEIIDALEVMPNGDLLISTKSSSNMPQNPGPPVKGKKSDLMIFHATQYGWDTIGTWEVYFDSLLISGLKKENIISLFMDPGLDKYVSFWDKYNVGGVMGDNNDIVVIHPNNTVTKFWEGTDWGYSGRVHGLHIVLGP